MISVRFVSALAAAAMVSVVAAWESSSVQQFPTPTVTLPAKAIKDVGCFATGVPLDNHGPHNFQSQGNCQLICIMLDKPVMALSNGKDCSCGELLPPVEAIAKNESCKTICEGSETLLCGGADHWFVSLTGTTNNPIKNYEPKSSSSSTTKGPPRTESTDGANSAVATSTNAPSENKSSGPNKAGIAAGVVVGVVVLAAIVAGVILFLRHKRRREVEEEYRRQAAVSSFTGGGKLHTSNSSMTDSRLDPEFVNRRQSNGSIADNEDYSRRILKVTNA